MSEGSHKPDKISLDGILDGSGPAGPPEEDAVIEIVSDEADSSSKPSDTDAAPGETPPRKHSAAGGREAARMEEMYREAVAEKDRVNDLYLRARADLENFRKRMERGREEDRQRAGAEILREVLPALDNLDRALAQPAETAGFREGIALIRAQLEESLRKIGMQPIEALGEPFDPAFHEALAVEQREGFATNTVIEEICRGYLYGGRVLRPSMVRVVVAPTTEPTEAQDGTAGEGTQGGADGPDRRD